MILEEKMGEYNRESETVHSCVDCGVTNCNKMDRFYPEFCLTTHLEQEDLEWALKQYNDNNKIMAASAEVEYEGYCRLTRVEEIMTFARKMGYKKLGIAYCIGLVNEARIFARILRANGFEVYSVICKVAGIAKSSIGIPKECEKIGAAMCNPILQARLLNQAHTELNVVIGLCVGHDSLFYKYSNAYTTTLVTKDRVTGHNPAAALYTANSYYRKKINAGRRTIQIRTMIQEFQIRVLPEQAANEQSLKQFIGHDKGLDIRTIHALRILKRSIDARQRTIYVNLKVRLYINEMPQDEEFTRTIYNKVDGKPQVIVVGAGPGGLFAALRLIELGLRPVVVERGKNVRDRKIDIARISREHKVAPESNYSFGEGGAGAYSDGKLYTRSKKRGNVNKILNVFCQHGASTSILADAHPHIGTDKLPRVIENMRNTIIECGGEVHFETRMDSLIIEKNKITGIETNTGKTFKGPVILATGHSARDVYRWLYDNGIEMETKGIAVGVRLEHPSMLIDQIQYHNKNGRGKYLPAAEYSFVTQVEGRGVYSFCMCPGGFVVPAASGPHQIVVNGMSPSNRGSKWSNSGMVVEIRPEDLAENNLFTEELKTKSEELKATNKNHGQWTTDHCPLTMMYFQEALEASCWQQGNMRQTAPSQRMVDFTRKKLSYDLPDSSYSPGLVSSPLHFWMPAFITDRLSKGFQQFGKSSHGFLTNEAVMIGVETRTSAPVRILRDNETLQHVTVNGLFPCGEGAGYAGGIVSAGIDGRKMC